MSVKLDEVARVIGRLMRLVPEVGRKVMEFTGRTGEYGGCVNYDIHFQE